MDWKLLLLFALKLETLFAILWSSDKLYRSRDYTNLFNLNNNFKKDESLFLKNWIFIFFGKEELTERNFRKKWQKVGGLEPMKVKQEKQLKVRWLATTP